jgi:hypothetical protein
MEDRESRMGITQRGKASIETQNISRKACPETSKGRQGRKGREKMNRTVCKNYQSFGSETWRSLRLGGSQSPCSSILDQRKFARAAQNLTYNGREGLFKRIYFILLSPRPQRLSGANSESSLFDLVSHGGS